MGPARPSQRRAPAVAHQRCPGSHEDRGGANPVGAGDVRPRRGAGRIGRRASSAGRSEADRDGRGPRGRFGRGRPRSPAPDRVQPALERDQVHARWRPCARRVAVGWRGRPDRGDRQRRGHRRR